MFVIKLIHNTEMKEKLLQNASEIFTNLKFLAKQELSVRGKDDKDSNFGQLLKLGDRDLPDLLHWLTQKTIWTSPDIQN